MLRSARTVLRRLGLACTLMLAVFFAMPASAVHACAEPCPPSSAVVQAPSSEGPAGCRDCDAGCRCGCCHASHASIAAPDLLVVQTPPVFAAPLSWSHSTAPPLADAAGPRRPPRF